MTHPNKSALKRGCELTILQRLIDEHSALAIAWGDAQEAEESRSYADREQSAQNLLQAFRLAATGMDAVSNKLLDELD